MGELQSPKVKRKRLTTLFVFIGGFACVVSGVGHLAAQVETVESGTPSYTWVSHGRVEGHLALKYSPAGAFSVDGTIVAIANENRIVLLDVKKGGVSKVLRPHLPSLADLEIQSANFLNADHVLVLASGLVETKTKGASAPSAELAFQWDTNQDALSGKVNALGAKGGFSLPRYFPDIRYVGLNKDNNFDLWNPLDGTMGRITIPSLTQPANLYALSPDGHWLILGQVQGNSTADPIVVRLSEHQFVDALRGHQGTVLSIAFSRDSSRVATACEDGKVRIYSVSDWKLLQTLSGHAGPVHWAEFSPDGKWVVSAGEDTTVRIWSGADGKGVADLRESQAPVLTAAFSPNGEFVAATAEHSVFIWERSRN
jgi:WD40 repeat protein